MLLLDILNGDIDPITGNPISPLTRDIAFDIIVTFGFIGYSLK